MKAYNILDELSKLNHDVKYVAEHLKANDSKNYATYKKLDGLIGDDMISFYNKFHTSYAVCSSKQKKGIKQEAREVYEELCLTDTCCGCLEQLNCNSDCNVSFDCGHTIHKSCFVSMVDKLHCDSYKIMIMNSNRHEDCLFYYEDKAFITKCCYCRKEHFTMNPYTEYMKSVLGKVHIMKTNCYTKLWCPILEVSDLITFVPITEMLCNGDNIMVSHIYDKTNEYTISPKWLLLLRFLIHCMVDEKSCELHCCAIHDDTKQIGNYILVNEYMMKNKIYINSENMMVVDENIRYTKTHYDSVSRVLNPQFVNINILNEIYKLEWVLSEEFDLF